METLNNWSLFFNSNGKCKMYLHVLQTFFMDFLDMFHYSQDTTHSFNEMEQCCISAQTGCKFLNNISQQMDWMKRSYRKATRSHTLQFHLLGTFEVCCIQECPRTIKETIFQQSAPKLKKGHFKGFRHHSNVFNMIIHSYLWCVIYSPNCT
jgi:hypothetical protein